MLTDSELIAVVKEGYIAAFNDDPETANPYAPANGGRAADHEAMRAWYKGYGTRLREAEANEKRPATRSRGGLAGSKIR